jgi:hypothetical protein
MSGILNSTLGTFRSQGAAVDPIVVTEMAKVMLKTFGASNLNSGAISMTAGRVYLVLLTHDPSGTANPTVTLYDGANTYTALTPMFTAPGTPASGSGVIFQIYGTIPASTSTRTISPTFQAPITAKTMVVLELTNATLTQRSTTTNARATNFGSTASTLSYTGPATVANTDIIISVAGCETGRLITSGSTSTTGGTWSTMSQISTSSGTNANNNIVMAYQYKILTASGAQSITWTSPLQPNYFGSYSVVLQHA